MTQDPISSDEQVPCIGGKSNGNGVMVTVGSLAGGGSKPGQGYQAVREGTIVRRLTPTECEALQGYPRGWTDNGQADSARYRQLGNSVAVPVVEWIARRLVATDAKCREVDE